MADEKTKEHGREKAQALRLHEEEQARLAGMAGGCAAYNEAIGSPLGKQGYCTGCLKDYGSGHHCCDC